MNRLRDFWYARRKEIIFAGFIAFAAALAFSLGYLAAAARPAPIIIEKCSAIDAGAAQ